MNKFDRFLTAYATTMGTLGLAAVAMMGYHFAYEDGVKHLSDTREISDGGLFDKCTFW